MVKVTKDEFFKTIGPQNVHPQIMNSKWPYTRDFKTPLGEWRGRIIDFEVEGDTIGSEYYLPDVTP
jgi:hypothetical protein